MELPRTDDDRVEAALLGDPPDGRRGIASRLDQILIHSGVLAPAVGFEPTTKRLTAARSTTELRRSEVTVGETIRAPSRRRAEG
jgi:hypothetical protein